MDTISPIKTILGIYRFSRLCSTFSGHAGAWTRTLELILKRELAVWGEALCLSVLRGLTWPQVQVRLSLAVNSVAWRVCVCVSHSKVSSRKTYRNPFNFTQIKRRNCDSWSISIRLVYAEQSAFFFCHLEFFLQLLRKREYFFYLCSLSVISLHGNSNCNIWSLCQR